MAAAIAFVASTAQADQGALGDCTQGTVIFAQDATITRPQVSLQPGVLFTDSGSFQAHGADEACDPGKSLGPFDVDAGGELILRLNGSPGIKPVWSLGNSGVGITVNFEPRIGNGFGPGQLVTTAVLGAEETETEAGGSWGGPGRVTAYVGAPRGSGPLTGSCFEQSYNAVAEVTSVTRSMPLVAGQEILPGDRIETGSNGLVRVQGSNEVYGPDTIAAYEAPTIGPATGAVTEPRAHIPHPGIAERPGFFGIWRDPDYNTKRRMWTGLQDMLQGMKDRGYDVPSAEALTGVHSDTLLEAYNRVAGLTNGCEAAHSLVLYLQSRSDAARQIWPQAATETALVWLLPNNYKVADLTIRGVIFAVKRKLAEPIKGLGYFELAENLTGTADVLYTHLWKGTDAGRRGRLGLAIFDQAIREKWTAEQIEDARRTRHARSQELLAEIEGIPQTVDDAVEGLKDRVTPMMAAIEAQLRSRLDEIFFKQQAGLEQIAADRKEWEMELARLRAVQPGEDMLAPSDGMNVGQPETGVPQFDFKWVRTGSDIEIELIAAEFQRKKEAVDSQARWDRAKAEAEAGAKKAAVETIVWASKLAIAHAAKLVISENLDKLADLEAESLALKDHVLPVVTGKCVPDDKPEPLTPCPPKKISILGGYLRYWTPESLRAVLPDGNPVENPRSGYFGVNLIGIDLSGFFLQPDGTDFEVVRTGDSGELRVFDGSVTVLTPDGRLGMVEAGQSITIPEGVQTDLPEGSGAPRELHGLPMTALPIDSNIPDPGGIVPFALVDGAPANGWLMQDPGNDAGLAIGETDGTFILGVPDGNEMWSGRGDAPRLLHKVTGDFDLALELNLALPEGANHFAFSEFVLYSPGSQSGYLARQASTPQAPGADFRLLGGGWSRFNGISSLPVWTETTGFTPPEDAMVKLRLRRRGDLFFSQWSLDGDHWTLGTRERIELPETIWAGLNFKRIAHDGFRDTLAVNTLKDMVLTSGDADLPVTEPLLAVQAAGQVTPLFEGWQLQHDPEIPGALSLTATAPVEGDFDAVLRVDLGNLAPESQGVAAALHVAGTEAGDWAYIAMSAGAAHGGRYQTHQSAGGTAGPFDWLSTTDQIGWLRMIRKEEIISTYYWQLGRWVALSNHEIHQDEALFLGIRSWNNWLSSTPAPFAPEVVLERLALGPDVGSEYNPKGYALLPEMNPPAIDLPNGVEAHLFTSPYPVQSPFFDSAGNLYLLPADLDIDRLIKLQPDGTSLLASQGKVFAGLNRKRGLWLDNQLFVTVDSWPQGGNGLGGLFSVKKDGTETPISLSQGLGGLSCLKALPDGNLVLCDFENDGIWKTAPSGGEIVNLATPPLACAQDLAVSQRSGVYYVVNNGSTYSCDGHPGVFRLDANGAPTLFLAREGEVDFGGLEWASGGIFGEGLYLVDPNSGSLLRLNERGGAPEVILRGLDQPGDLAVGPSGDDFAVVLDGAQVLVLRKHAPVAETEPPAAEADKVPEQAEAPGPVESTGKDVVVPDKTKLGNWEQEASQTESRAVTPEQPTVDTIPTPETPAEKTWMPVGPGVTVSLNTIAAVQNGPSQPSILRVDAPVLLQSIMTYHWNQGRGSVAGTIGLRDGAGNVIGPWQAYGTDGQGGVSNAYWHVAPGVVIQPGKYVIIDSDPSTWATNAEVKNRGIFEARMRAVELQ